MEQQRVVAQKSKIAADKIAKEFRDVRCPQQLTKAAENACVAAYDVIIARINAEQRETELGIASAALPASQRDQILKLVSGYNKHNEETVAMSDQFDLLFPAGMYK